MNTISKDNQGIASLKKQIVELEGKIAKNTNHTESLTQILESFNRITRKENSIYSINEFNLQCKFVYISPSVKHIGGYEPEELIGNSFFDIVHPDDKKDIILPLLKNYIKNRSKKLIKGKMGYKSETFVYRMKDEDGNWRYAETTSNIIRNKIVNITTDVGERKEVEKKLHQTQVDFKNLLSNLDDIYYRINKEGIITDINPAIKKVMGYSHNELIGKHVKAVFSNQDSRYSFIDEIKKKEIVRDFEVELEHKKGNKIYVSANSYIIKNDNDNPIGIEGILRNITEQKRVEEKLRIRNNELELFNEVTVDRELKMIELKNEINELLEASGKKPKYIIVK